MESWNATFNQRQLDRRGTDHEYGNVRSSPTDPWDPRFGEGDSFLCRGEEKVSGTFFTISGSITRHSPEKVPDTFSDPGHPSGTSELKKS